MEVRRSTIEMLLAIAIVLTIAAGYYYCHAIKAPAGCS
jgi:hypothetical protein